MTRTAAALVLVLLAGCHRPSFDERYRSAQHKLEEKSAAIDRELGAAASDAAAAGVLPSEDAGGPAGASPPPPGRSKSINF